MDESRQDNLANANLAKRMKANLKADLGVKADELKAENLQQQAENDNSAESWTAAMATWLVNPAKANGAKRAKVNLYTI